MSRVRGAPTTLTETLWVIRRQALIIPMTGIAVSTNPFSVAISLIVEYENHALCLPKYRNVHSEFRG